MTKINCENTLCIHNKHLICKKKEIVIDHVGYVIGWNCLSYDLKNPALPDK